MMTALYALLGVLVVVGLICSAVWSRRKRAAAIVDNYLIPMPDGNIPSKDQAPGLNRRERQKYAALYDQAIKLRARRADQSNGSQRWISPEDSSTRH